MFANTAWTFLGVSDMDYAAVPIAKFTVGQKVAYLDKEAIVIGVMYRLGLGVFYDVYLPPSEAMAVLNGQHCGFTHGNLSEATLRSKEED